jgi:hypothetical protein
LIIQKLVNFKQDDRFTFDKENLNRSTSFTSTTPSTTNTTNSTTNTNNNSNNTTPVINNNTSNSNAMLMSSSATVASSQQQQQSVNENELSKSVNAYSKPTTIRVSYRQKMKLFISRIQIEFINCYISRENQ